MRRRCRASTTPTTANSALVGDPGPGLGLYIASLPRISSWAITCRASGTCRVVSNRMRVLRVDARPQVVDGRDGIQSPHPGRQASGRGRIAAGAVGEPERGLLEDARRPLDIDPVDIVVVARRPVGSGVEPDAVDVFELDARLALVDPVDGEPNGGDMARLDDALDDVALGRCHPLVPRG